MRYKPCEAGGVQRDTETYRETHEYRATQWRRRPIKKAHSMQKRQSEEEGGKREEKKEEKQKEEENTDIESTVECRG